MSKQLNVSLAFTADTSQARAQLQSLQASLNKLVTESKTNLGIEDEIRKAITATADLSVHLKRATNLETGNLDFAKFNRSIKSSGMSLKEYGAHLQSLGPSGQQAFLQLAQSVATAEIPLRRSNTLLKELGVTMANTARWQLSSSMLHGFMGAIQSAYGYAQDLNESLNNIRIVTGQNIDQMSKFAKEANKAARALSATTTDYTNASLIYYQQGLNEKEVKERTDITIKMANVARQSAEVVSDQMTAVWNNFADGTKPLEHYADVMTALGAATASSTDEIAGGLEKFAAIGDTIGLSFEYAASALATITSNTRQSEEVVGTALKTIFARIQGLKLGETLEDGTSLNKYSKALNTVGISIYDSTGELKAMDNILDEMAMKWGDMSKAQQAALAQTVAGVRQYTQLVALMENWDNGDSDSMMANLNTSATSAGALQEQADIYAESWEAARDRVTASLEAIYSQLIDDEAFIDILNNVEKTINFVSELIDSLGGLKGTLAAVGAIITKVFSDQLAAGLSNMAYNIKMSTKAGRNREINERKAFIDNAVNSVQKSPDYVTKVEKAQQSSMRSQLELQQRMLEVADKMSQEELERNQLLLDRNKLMQENLIAAAKEEQSARSALDQTSIALSARMYSISDPKKKESTRKVLNEKRGQIKNRSQAEGTMRAALSDFQSNAESGEKGREKGIKHINKTLAELSTSGDDQVRAVIESFGTLDLKAENVEETIREIIAQLEGLKQTAASELKTELIGTVEDPEERKAIRKEVDAYVESMDNWTESERKHTGAVREGEKAQEAAFEGINKSKGAQKRWSDTLVESVHLALNAAMAFQMFGSMIDTLESPDATGWDKFLSVMMTLGMTLPMLVDSFQTLKSLISAETIEKAANTAATMAQIAAEKKLNLEKQFSKESFKTAAKDLKTQTKEKLSLSGLKSTFGKEGRGKLKGKLTDTWNDKFWDALSDEQKIDFEDMARQSAFDNMSKEQKYAKKREIFDRLSQKEKEAEVKKRGFKVKKEKGKSYSGSISNKQIDQLVSDDAVKQEMNINPGDTKNLAGKSGLKALVANAAPMLISAVAIAGIVGMVSLVMKQMNAAEEALERAKASSKQLSENFDAAKASYEEFISAHSQYDTAIKSMDKLIKGTAEYEEALLQANEAAGELLATNKDLEYTIKDGLVEIDKDSLEKSKKKQLKNQQKAYAAKMEGEAQVTRAEENLEKRDLSRDLKSTSDVGIKAGNAAIGGLAGAVLGGAAVGGAAGAIAGGGIFSLITGIAGAVVGASVGLITGIAAGVASDTASGSEDKAIEALAEKAENDSAFLAKIKSGKLTDEEFEALDIKDDRLINSLRENGEEVAELISEMQQNTAALNAQNDLVASQTLSENKVVQSSEFRDQIIDITGDSFGAAKEQALKSDEVKDWGKEGISKISGSGNKKSKEVFAEYLKYAGLEGQGYTFKTTTGSDSKREFVYTDKEGEEHKVSLEAMQAARASYEASKTLDENATKLAATFEKLADSSEKADKALLAFLSGKSFEGATKGEYEAIKGELETDDDGNYTDDSVKTYLQDTLGETEITDEVAIEYGYENAQAMIDGFKSKLSKADDMWEDLNEDAPASFKKLGDSVISEMSLGTTKSIRDQIEKMNIGPMGEKAGEEYVSHLNKVIKGLNSEDQQKVLDEFAKIDWSDWDAADQAKRAIKELGLNIDTSTNSWLEFAESMRVANASIPDFSKLKSDLNAIAGIIQKLEFGSVIDEADYQTLIDKNSEWEKFFILQADGTRKFIGNEEKMQEAIRDTIKADREKLAKNKEVAEAVKKDKDVDLNNLSDTEVEKAAGGDGKDGLFKFTNDKNNKATNILEKINKNYQVNDDGTITLDGKEVSQEDASAKVMAYQKAVEAENLMSNDNIKEALAAAGYSEKKAKEYIEEGKKGNGEGLQMMLDALNNIVNTDYDQVDQEYDEMLASTATSLADLDSLSAKEKWDPETESKGLISLASNYEACRGELEEYNKAVEKYGEGSKKAEKAQKNLRKAIRDADWRKVTKDVKKYWSELKKLKDADEIADKQKEIADAFNKAWGTNVTSTFVKENKKLIDEWANSTGDKATEVALEIQQKAVLASGKADQILNNTKGTITVDVDGDGKIEEIKGRWSALKAIVEANPITINAKGKADLTNLMDTLFAAGYTAQEVANYLASIGQTEISLTGAVAGDADSLDVDLSSPEGMQAFLDAFKNTSVDFSAESISVPSAGVADMSNYSSGDSGGGSEPKKTSEARKSKSDMVDRYKEINDELEETGRQMEKNNTLADGLWGEKRFKKLRENIKLMKQERKELDEKYKLSKKYLKEDKQELKEQSGLGNSDEADEQREALGMTVNFKFDDDGYITNYTSEMTKLYNKREALLKSFGDTMDENEQKRLEEFDNAFDNLKTAYEQYEQTMDERDDLEEEKMQKKLEQQEAYLELLNEEADLKDQINEAELEFIEYYLSKVEDDMFSQVEGLGYMGQQANVYAGNLQNQESLYKDLTKAFKNGDISEPQYKQAMQEMQSVTIENLQALQESKKAMQDYYGNTLAMAQEELAAFTDQMEHLNSVFDHYTSLLDLLGKRKNFTVSGQVLMGKANNVKNELDVYREEYEMYSKEADKWEKKMLKAEIGSTKYETYKKNWEAAQQAANEAQENMLAKTEEWAEAMRAVVKNNLQGLAAELEATLTNGSNFDTILNSMERANNLQEEYLTATNKIYETNKLMRTAQQEIDKTSNEVAKRRMKEFIAETKQLQNQGQLSKYELEIQQAKYDLLLAEIALEEAQNAKSTVRLQRDSEGNFGYVYTADSSKTAEAEQKMADAQNRLYNIGLEGANDYNQKYAETMSELYNDLAELQQQYLEGQFATEDEYQAAVEASKKYHYDKLKQYSSLYQVALTTDSRVVADAWSTDFNDMIYKTEEWTSAINDYTDKAASELAVWAETVNTVITESGLDNIDSELEKMAEESEKLKNVLVGDDGLIEAIKEQVKEVGKLSQKYLKVQKAIDKVIESYEKFLGKVNKKFTGTSDTGATVITLPTPQGYDTGGYTGEWGSWGKLAMLHEKEMVLNKEDTSNLLRTMEFLDNIIKTIDLQATNAALGGLLSSPSFGGLDQHDVLEQNVKIEASFPNVSNRAEIEEAFETLVNRASQYANRK